MDDLVRYPFIGREEGSGTREVMEGYLDELGLDSDQLDISMELGSPESIKNAVAAGLGISIISITTMEKELQLGPLCAIPLEKPIRRSFSTVHQRQKFRMRAMDEFMQFTQEHCRNRSKPL